MRALFTVCKRLSEKAFVGPSPIPSWVPRRPRSAGGVPACNPAARRLVFSPLSEVLEKLRGQVEVRENFISEEEERALLRELEPGLKKKRYEFDHWDDAIHGYRETERLRWGPECEAVLERIRSAAFPQGSQLLGPVHVLDLDQKGYIKAHIDSVKFCGSTIAGVSLLSDSVMRLVSEDKVEHWADLLLLRRSLYIIRDRARYKFTHEVLKDEDSFFLGERIPRERRISVICRNLPT
ncbi:alpha-ketoglutarate-dependent dioxygenase alkB homolog 7, mitochondrial [Brienomyrus brachyistius]|uniref:alpha-ketoglutarate-dependent dioxygenase alkB homolog 7, mitochondrial n=1 Tax=Brienomyrus brachyistius TaxID=42636 RepID=UPI0020B230ED|nr:alpha-ketoglutarate-dependent dioxygenase alkB homolog 7, mitochondrial [Brienomyrus brachyistius]